MARWSFGNAFVRLSDATPFFGSAGTATADSVTAATAAELKPGAASVAAPTIAISEARKESSITETGNANIAAVAPA